MRVVQSTGPLRHPLLRRRRPRHPLPRPRPAPRDQPPGDNRTARRLHRRENHRRRILRPHRHRRGHRDRLTTTTPPRPPEPRPAPRPAGFLTPARGHRERHLHGHLERPRTGTSRRRLWPCR